MRKVDHLRQSVPPDELSFEVAACIRTSGQRDLTWVVEHLQNHPEKATSVRRFLEAENREEQPRLSITESLRFLCENDLSKRQYQNIRALSQEKGFDLYPTYNEVCTGKSFCYPDGMYSIQN